MIDTLDTSRTPSVVLDKAILEIKTEEESNGFNRGELKPFLEKIAKKYDVSFHSIRNRYYKEPKVEKPVKAKTKVKRTALVDKKTRTTNEASKTDEIVPTGKKDDNIIPPTNYEAITVKTKPVQTTNVDDSISNYSQKQAEKMFNYPKDHYKIGQFVDVKVVNIQSYGCFCEILDGKGFQALCHISEMVDGFIKKVTDFVEVGDIIKQVRICLMDNKRLNVSMKHVHLQKKENEISIEPYQVAENPAINNLGEKFGNLKDKLFTRANENKATTSTNIEEVKANDLNEIEEIFDQEALSESQEKIIKKYERDIEEMTSYLQEQLGALTPQAKLELANIIEEKGLFATTIGIVKTQENFKADIGLLFMQQMKEKLGDYL